MTATQKRWTICMGLVGIEFEFHDRPLGRDEVEFDPHGHFHAWAIAQAEKGERELMLTEEDQSFSEVYAALPG